MQTTPVLNPLLATKTTPAQTNRGAEQNAPAQPFNQVLSREMADRQKVAAKEPAKATDAAKAAQGPAPQKAAAKDKAGKSEETREARESSDSEDVEKSSAADAGAAAAADMLALVANIAPVVAPVTETRKADVSVETEAEEGAAITSAGDLLSDVTGGAKAARPDAVVAAATSMGKPVEDKAAKAFIVTDTRAVPAEARTGTGTDVKQAFEPKPEAGEAESIAPDTAPKAEAAPSPVKPSEDFAAKGQALMRGQHEADTKKPVVEPAQNAMQVAGPQPSSHAALQALNNAAVRADHLAPRVGSNGWDQALGQKITWMVAGEQQTASLTLNPPDLGPLQVVLSVSNSQANATFTAAQPEVRQALEAAMPKLRDMLGEAGIQLGQASVNSGNPQQQGQTERQAAGTPSQRFTGSEPAAEPVARTARVAPSGSGRGMVDTFA